MVDDRASRTMPKALWPGSAGASINLTPGRWCTFPWCRGFGGHRPFGGALPRWPVCGTSTRLPSNTSQVLPDRGSRESLGPEARRADPRGEDRGPGHQREALARDQGRGGGQTRAPRPRPGRAGRLLPPSWPGPMRPARRREDMPAAYLRGRAARPGVREVGRSNGPAPSSIAGVLPSDREVRLVLGKSLRRRPRSAGRPRTPALIPGVPEAWRGHPGRQET